MIFPIDNVDPKHQVIVYENIPDLIQRVKWQDIFELIFILFYKNATEFGWSYILDRTDKVSHSQRMKVSIAK